MARTTVDKCKVEYYNSDRVKVSLYFPRRFWEEVKGFVRDSGFYPSTCFYFFVWGKIGFLTHNGMHVLRDFAYGFRQVIRQVNNYVKIFYDVQRPRRVRFKNFGEEIR